MSGAYLTVGFGTSLISFDILRSFRFFALHGSAATDANNKDVNTFFDRFILLITMFFF